MYLVGKKNFVEENESRSSKRRLKKGVLCRSKQAQRQSDLNQHCGTYETTRNSVCPGQEAGVRSDSRDQEHGETESGTCLSIPC